MSRVLVTGASGVIGGAIAHRLAADGWTVTLCGRNEARLRELPGDVLVHDVTSAWPTLPDVDAVVCAAGWIGPIGTLGEIDPRAVLETLRVNVLGSLLALKACPNVRAAVLLSGGGATGPFERFSAYAASKAAVVRLAENLAAEGLRINAVAPGFIVSHMQSEVLEAGPERVGEAYYRRVSETTTGDDPARAAALVAFLLSDGAEGISGKLLSAPWDPWDDPTFQARLRDDRDLATLRRIDDQFFVKK